ncbi:MAG: LacI family DNA-binding transcriptional regulator [Armatimonadetes bacterium]|nr:LacI family DNA-binding transcriptional regulator [Armatimonadota bacterium]
MADIARETGLTLGTVSRALNNSVKYPIAAETRERVLEAATRLGYRPNQLGKALAEGKSMLIMLLTPNPFAPYYSELNRHLSLLAVNLGYSLLIPSITPEQSPPSTQSIDWLYGVDAIIVCDLIPAWEGYMNEAARLKIPMVGMGALRPTLPIDFVWIDLYKASRDVFAHLVEVGCKSIAFLGTPLRDNRRVAYLDAVEAFGLEPRIIEMGVQSRSTAREAAAIAYRERPFDGLICENDIVATGALLGLADAGAKVPQDVRLAGCDGLEESQFQLVPITTLVQPLEQCCQSAWNLLQDLMNGAKHAPQFVKHEATLEVRTSTSG